MRAFARVAMALMGLALAAVVVVVEAPEIARPLLPGALGVLLPPPLPSAQTPSDIQWLDQNWTKVDRDWVHHASQGSATLPVPYDWFLALEQPGLALFTAPGLLRDDSYLARIGFLPDTKFVTHGDTAMAPSTSLGWREADNSDGLPIGFARTKIPGEADRIGLTCAACHTGQIAYRGKSIRFDGGPAMLNLNALERAVSLSIFYTLKVPGRFDRFAARVLGPSANEAPRENLRADLQAVFDAIIVSVQTTSAINAARGEQDTPENFGRIDALNRIGNRVFFEDFGGTPKLSANFHATDAPVRFPALWTTPWFAYAEYDSSIAAPLVRNVGEAMGVGARFSRKGQPAYASSVALDNIVWIEDLLRGADPFAASPPRLSGLLAPKWPQNLFAGDPAWAIDPAKVERGRALYAEICAACHLGPASDPAFDRAFPQKAFWSAPNWRRGAEGTRLDLNTFPVAQIGSDPAQAMVLKTRTIDPPEKLALTPQQKFAGCDASLPEFATNLPFGVALMETVERTALKWLDDANASEEDRRNAFGPRKNCPNPISEPVYRARPLDGVWAMAPYLHNGAVPSLDLLLRPAAQRPRQFCLGGRDYDPRLVGYDPQKPCAEGESLFSAFDQAGTPVKGNSVAGHSFENGGGAGVVGRALSDDERAALLDYLKTL